MCAAFGHATSTRRSVDVGWKGRPFLQNAWTNQHVFLRQFLAHNTNHLFMFSGTSETFKRSIEKVDSNKASAVIERTIEEISVMSRQCCVLDSFETAADVKTV